jgi:uncharacterized metal-binding protein YceD (DUF177 family)
MENQHFFIELNDRDILEKSFTTDLNDQFFQEMGGYISKGNIKAVAVCKKAAGNDFNFMIHSVGYVSTPCDRCLDDVELRIDIQNSIEVKIGEQDEDDGDSLIVAAEHHAFDLNFLVYQLVALSLPITRVHQPGRCNQAMMKILSQHQVARSNEETDDVPDSEPSQDDNSEQATDHRWDKLKQLLNK